GISILCRNLADYPETQRLVHIGKNPQRHRVGNYFERLLSEQRGQLFDGGRVGHQKLSFNRRDLFRRSCARFRKDFRLRLCLKVDHIDQIFAALRKQVPSLEMLKVHDRLKLSHHRRERGKELIPGKSPFPSLFEATISDPSRISGRLNWLAYLFGDHFPAPPPY